MDKTLKDMEIKGHNLKKTEKLVTAIYMLTSFFDEKEPMKWRLRELGSKLLSMSDNHAVVQEIISLLEVSKHAGLISDMNFDIIHREFSRLLPEPLSIHNLLVSSTNMETKEEANIGKTANISVRDQESFYVASSLPSPVRETASLTPIKDKELLHTESDRKALKEFGAVAVKKNSRQSVIISLLKRKKEIMIKDVSPLIDGVSEKTIQRELGAMVKAGILKRTGEKRWSKYSLAE